MENKNNTKPESIEERLKRIKNKNNIEQPQNINDDEISNEPEDQSSKSLDLNKLKNKVKMDNAPQLKNVKNLSKDIQKIKNEFAEATNTTINKEKFLGFIKQANEMSKNYEKQLQYYAMYSGKYNTKDLSICENIRKFCIAPDKRKVFESELNKLNLNTTNPDFKKLQKLYQDKIDNLFKENKNLNKIIEKMSNEVVMSFQNRIQELFDENTRLKTRNGELEEKLIKVKFIFADNERFFDEMNEKDAEIVELNKQQILSMNKYEKAMQEIKKLNKIIDVVNDNIAELENSNNKYLEEIKKLKNTLEEKENIIKEKSDKISEQEKQIKLLFDDNVQWEAKYNEKVKENENFKKWAMWDQDIVESFRKIEKLTEELNATKANLEKFTEENKIFKENNKKLNDELDITKKRLNEELDKNKKCEEKLKKDGEELTITKKKNEELEIRLKDYLETKKQNETYKKEIPAIKDEYETKIINDKNNFEIQIEKLKSEQENKINEIKSQNNLNINNLKDTHQQNINKLNDQIQTLKDEITILKEEISKRDKNIEDLNNQLDKKAEVLSNLKKSYDNLINKIKVSEEKLAQYEQNNKKHKSVFNDEDDTTNENSNKNNKSENNTKTNNENKKITTTFDQFSFTKEVLNDYLYCLYLLETGISIQSLVSDIIGNLSLYSNYAFKLSKLNKSHISNYPLHSIQNEFLEDVYFVSFDKYISKKFLFNKDEIYINGYLDKKILKVNYEDFDQGTINEICLELINKNIMTKLKIPKTLAQLSQLFNSKYNKKFDFEGAKLNDYLSKEIVPVVQKRILKYNKSIIDDMRTLVELSLHNLKDGKITIDGEEVYSFEKFFEQYNNYTNISERNLKIDIENGNCICGEAIDNLKHTLKYYYPQIIRLDNCFKNDNKDNNIYLGYINKILASINYYQINVTQLSFINNKLDKIFNKNILSCVKLIKTLVMLDLSNNGLNEENIKELFEFLKENKTIKILYLNNNNLTSSSGYYLADCFKKNISIEILHLSHNKITDSGFDSFLNILGNDNSTLKELDISYNELSLEDFKVLSNYLNLNPPLKSLDISGNNLENKSANLIGVTFKKLTNLEEIKLNNCSITDESAPQVLMYLNESIIKNLEIDSNKFGPMAPMLILKKIQVSNKLKYISFQKMEFQPYFVDMIIQAININNSIERVNLKNNKIKEEDLKKFVDAVSKLKNVKFLFSRDMVPSNASEIISGNRGIILQ